MRDRGDRSLTGSKKPAPAAAKAPAPKPDAATGEGGAPGLPKVTWTPGQTAVGLIAALLLGVIVPDLLILPFDSSLDSTAAKLAAQGLFALVLIGTAIFMARTVGSFSLSETLDRLGWRPFKLSGLGWALLALLAYFIAAAVYVAIFGEPHQDDVGGELGIGDGLIPTISAVVLIAVLAPISEETLFRGFVFGGIRDRLSLWPAALISGVIFGAVHIPEGPTAAIPLAIFGVALAWTYNRTGSIWPGICIHALNNAIALALIS